MVTDRPGTAQNWPAGHTVHTEKPVAGANEPAAHGVGTDMPELGQNEPAGHKTDADMPADVQTERTGHEMHVVTAVAPVEPLNVPARHSVGAETPAAGQNAPV